MKRRRTNWRVHKMHNMQMFNLMKGLRLSGGKLYQNRLTELKGD